MSVARTLVMSLLTMSLLSSAANGQALTVRNDHFAVQGRGAKFFVFIHYADGVDRIPDNLSTSVLDADLQYFVDSGISGLRVFPNWQDTSETLMHCDGTLRSLQMQKLQLLVDRAALKQLVVDVSFTLDTVKLSGPETCMTAPAYRDGLQTATTALVGKTNVFFDLQNEMDHGTPPRLPIPDPGHPGPWTFPEWGAYLAVNVKGAVKAADPTRQVTVSWTSDRDRQEVFNNVIAGSYDILAYHYRNANTWPTDTTTHVNDFRARFVATGVWRPIYLQEPYRFPFDTDVTHYQTAVQHAKRAGAAAWTFNNSSNGTDLGDSVPFQNKLYQGERDFLAWLANPVNLGQVSWGYHAVPNDADADGRADLEVYRPSDGSWLTRLSTLGYDQNAPQWFFWGQSSDTPLAADFDGDSKRDLVTYRPSGGLWRIRYSSQSYNEATAGEYQWGLSTDVPLSADFDGDGRTDLVVWRPSDGGWYIRLSSKGYDQAQWVFYQWGLSTDKPLVADFDGDKRTDLVVWRPSDGGWYIRLSSKGYSQAEFVFHQWGQSGDIPLVTDFDGDERTDLAVWHPDGTWRILFSSTGYSWPLWWNPQWGLSTDVPLVRDIDGDGKTDLTVYRPSEGGWYIRLSSLGYNQALFQYYQWGVPNSDIPLRP